ncbi:hypothetical protein CNR22_15770 [Sphingobacteriaceae bacterium]|nr:hypothetical protein CNR22_15770 [Sphingobacteriaceae bacterium]
MKLLIGTLVIAGNIFFISCKKERSCSCKYQSVSTYTYVAKNGGATSNTVTTNSGESNQTYAKVKKDDLTRLYDCNSRNETSVNTYTTQRSVATQTTIGGNTFTTYVSADYDVTQKNSTDYTCEVK